MLLESRDKYRLDQDGIKEGAEAGAATEAANLLYAMMDDAIAASGDSLEVKMFRSTGRRISNLTQEAQPPCSN